MTPTVVQLLSQARQCLAERLQLPETEARIEAQLLLSRALGGVSRAWLITHEQDTPALDQHQTFESLLERRLNGEPVAYLLGQREFFGLPFNVTPAVLIPRPDTEILVETALALIPDQQAMRVLDMGVGSGAIAIAIAKNRPQTQVVGIDRSEAALEVAKANAEALDAPNADFLLSHWFSSLGGEEFDVIVSNPPYIAAGDPHLAQGDLRFEPSSALASGTDGLNDIREIVAQAPGHLKSQGWLLLEHGYDQAKKVADLMRANSFIEVRSVADLSGILRVTLGQRP
ncbi:release factor glutamine methyltransferase [Novimethylophilus kurashikiensis]|uniref:Release factor glutamine methyltransferase n=1 Tax=Novimethylophilus kurashikiensis TaxID=1825523 RepID=A0A2R5F800_9PROT|nr:peptide chain release factor N(5)-glutamine methyltransferase [Novimethylophilus kurashikiensis]GBG13678.1 release factor glutamine methyltransferase [Novimethylophilus kurashikiensis]